MQRNSKDHDTPPSLDARASVLPSRGRAITLVAIAMLLHIALHVAASVPQRHLEYDDSISYLAASGHQGAYSAMLAKGNVPYGAWSTAGEWQRLLAVDQPFTFGRIASDLGTYDIHPPLYFWFLHLGLVVFGLHAWVGPLLNLGLDLLSIVAVFLLARRVLGDARHAGWAALVWSIAPGPLQASLEARQYSLLGLVSIVFLHQVLRAADRDERFGLGAFVLLCASTWLGLLTQYQFVVLAGVAALLLVLRLQAHDRRRLGVALGALFLGGALLLPKADLVLASMARQQAQLPPFGWAALLDRVSSLLAAPSTFFAVGKGQQILWTVLGLGAAIWLGRRGARLRDVMAKLDRPAQDMLVFLGLVFGAFSLLFMAFRTPSFSMQPKYFAWSHPLLACLFVLGLREVAGRAKGKLPLLAGFFLLANTISLDAVALHRSLGENAARRELASVDRVLLDTSTRGVALPVLWQLPADLPVFVADQCHLVDHPDRWLPALTSRSIWIDEPAQGNTAEGRARIEALLRPRFELAPSRSVLWPRQTVYLFRN